MYSKYITHFRHSIQFLYPVYSLYCIVHTDYTDIVSYTSLFIQNVCKNKCAVYAMYSVHIAYIYRCYT